MKHKAILALSVIAILALIFGYGMYYYYAPPKERQPYTIGKHRSDTIRVAYIGDSWAFFHQPYDGRFSDSLTSKLHRPAKIYSQGYCGRSSKEIYWYFFDTPKLVSFFSRGYDYCFVCAGINDANKKMTSDYYAQSMDYIIQFLLKNQITPIILEIPDYDIERMYRWEIPSRKLLRSFSRFITGTPINCKVEFRVALDQLIAEKDYGNKIEIIRYKNWNNNYKKDINTLYMDDGIHLNEQGYAKLDSCVAEAILKIRNKEKHGKD